MSLVSVSRWEPRKHSRKQRRACSGVRGSTAPTRVALGSGARRPLLRPVARTENRGFGTLPMSEVAESPLLCAFCCFPPASPAFVPGSGKQKTVPTDHSTHLILLRKLGAGEGIRTLDPNLCKNDTYGSSNGARSRTRYERPICMREHPIALRLSDCLFHLATCLCLMLNSRPLDRLPEPRRTCERRGQRHHFGNWKPMRGRSRPSSKQFF